MKKSTISCFAAAAIFSMGACSNVVEKTTDTVGDTTTTVAHKTDPFATDTTTTTTQKSLQQPVDAASTRDLRDSN